MQLKFNALALGLGASALLVSGAALAQHYTPPPQHQPSMHTPGTAHAHVSAQTLAKFKHAYRSVKAIDRQYSAKVRKVHDRQAALRLRQWAQKKMAHAVKSSGLTIPQYDHVMLLLQREPALRKKVFGH